MNTRSWGIKRRVVFLALAPAAVIAIALTAYFLFVRYGDVETALRSRGESIVRQLAPAAEYGVFSGNRAELLRLARAAVREPDVISVTILDNAYHPLAIATPAIQPDSPIKISANANTPTPERTIEIFHAAIRQPELPFDDPFQRGKAATSAIDKPIGHVVVELSRKALEARKRETLLVTLVATVATLAVSLLLAFRLGRDIAEPVMAIEKAVSKVRLGHRNVRLQPHPSRTLVSLEEGFNEMAAALDATHRHSANALANSEEALAKQLEVAQAKQEEAERANEGKSHFLAAASHDLRQPLHALMLFATELSASTGEGHRELAARIGTATGAMNELLDALLEASRLDIGAIAPQRQAVALGPLLKATTEAHKQTAKIKSLRLVCRPTAAWVDTDPHLLRRMLGNLIANAVRYTRQGHILVAARNRGTSICIEIWDTGIGIEHGHLPYLFHEFYQIDNPERNAAKGLGLGLAIVARLGELLGHRVEVRSKPGRGSVFSVTVPKAIPSTGQTSLAAPPPHAKIAVCMADIGQCQKIGRLLQAWGYESHHAHTDDDLARLLGSPLSVAICDIAHLDKVGDAIRGLVRPPLLIFVGSDETGSFGNTLIAARLSIPLRPARLRALLHHLLHEQAGESQVSDDASPVAAG